MLKFLKASVELSIALTVCTLALVWYVVHEYGVAIIIIAAVLLALHIRKGKVEAAKVTEEVPPKDLEDPRVEDYRKFLKQMDGVGK